MRLPPARASDPVSAVVACSCSSTRRAAPMTGSTRSPHRVLSLKNVPHTPDCPRGGLRRHAAGRAARPRRLDRDRREHAARAAGARPDPDRVERRRTRPHVRRTGDRACRHLRPLLGPQAGQGQPRDRVHRPGPRGGRDDPARPEPRAAPRARRPRAHAPRRRRAVGRPDPRLPRGRGPGARAHRHGRDVRRGRADAAAHARRRAARRLRPPPAEDGALVMTLAATASTSLGSGNAVQILLMLGGITLVPALLFTVTGFSRILIVLGFIRSGLGTPTTPPNQVLVGIALFLTLFVMQPTFAQVKKQAWDPLQKGKITQVQALDRAQGPMRDFMFRQTRTKDIALFAGMAKLPRPKTRADIPTYVLIPAFIISELKTAFQIGFLIFLPFLVIDLVVSSTLMSMGMVMLPPVFISLPFKILLFVLVDGWNLVTKATVESFHL